MSSIAFTNGFQSKIEYFSFLFSFQSIIVDKLITHYTTWILSQIVKTKEKLTCRNINYYFIIIIYYIKLLLFHFLLHLGIELSIWVPFKAINILYLVTFS